MKRNLSTLGKISLTLAGLFLLAGPFLAQTSLNKGLDYSGDGKAEYTIFRPSTATFWSYNAVTATWSTYNFGSGITVRTDEYFTPGDYDGDGKGDISIWRSSTQVWYRLMSGTSTVVSSSYGQAGDEPVARDYDGDGKTDLATVTRAGPSPTPAPHTTPSPGTMTWNIQKSSGGSTTVQYGYDSDYAVPGNYDGDSKFDIAVCRPGTLRTQNVFYVLKSSTGTTQTTSFGLGGDMAVPGDYDGDGKTDIAVVRGGRTHSQNYIWHILGSTAGYSSVAWGLADFDKTAQADYDGDGKADPTVWRYTDGNFYVLKSTGGYSVVNWGTAGDFPVAGYDTH